MRVASHLVVAERGVHWFARAFELARVLSKGSPDPSHTGGGVVGKVTFPYADYFPAATSELPGYAPVPALVSVDLGKPRPSVCPGAEVPSAFVAVPKAPVYENCEFCAYPGKVRVPHGGCMPTPASQPGGPK